MTNSAKADLRLIDLSLMRLRLPGWADKTHGEGKWPHSAYAANDPSVLAIRYDGGTLLFCGEQVDDPPGLHVVREKETDDYALVLRHEGPPFMGLLIPHGQSHHFLLSLRFGPKDASVVEMAKDIYARFGELYPMQMKWDDHRPIGTLNLASSERSVEKNPRGWFGDAHNVDVTTDAGREAFHQRMLKHADLCIGFAKEINAQGVIVWDIEGEEMPHAISYIGDPRLMDQMAPEMADIADVFMKKFTDAGLRIGVTVRPTHVVRTPSAKHPWGHVAPDDIVEEISQKIEYANKRWGCTLFYVDSTVQWVTAPDGTIDLKVLPAEYFAILNKRFPNVLLIPEQSTTRTWAYAACYHELQQGYPSTPASVRACYPGAFSVLRVVDAEMKLLSDHHDELVAGVRAGDIILFRSWFDDKQYNDQIKQIYREAKGN